MLLIRDITITLIANAHLPPLPLNPLPIFGIPGLIAYGLGGFCPAILRSASTCYCSLLGFLIVWSTERIVHAASVAAVITLIRTTSGSHTNYLYILLICELITSTPYQVPSSPSCACFYLNLFNTSVESMPEFSANCFGMISSALAKAFITSCCLPAILRR